MMKPMTKQSLTAIVLLVMLAFASSTTVSAQRLQQKMGRGVVAVKNGSNATITWRRFAQEPEDAKYNVYVNGTKLNSSPLSNTNYATQSSLLPAGAKVTVTLVKNGVEQEQSGAYIVKNYDLRNIFVDIHFERGGSPLQSSNFDTSYVWPVDLDGDGEMDYVVNRINNTNRMDCYVEGYLSSGEHLWTVKLGPNELSCSGQDDQICAYDIDCDGKGELIVQTSDGTQFWDPDKKTFGLFVNGNTTGDTDGDGIIDYEKQSVKNAPRYMTVVDGMTGREKASVEQTYTSDYTRTNRASLMGDEYNKHVGHVGIFYHDGVHPAIVMEWHTRDANGGHHYHNSAWAYDYVNGEATNWHQLFCKTPGGPAFHQIRIGDTDQDGRDEMIVGGYTMDHDGNTLFNTGIAHGDRFRTSDIDPERPGLETFSIQQYAGDMLGQILYDARTGEPIKKWYLSATGDVGRGECMDIDANHKGWEMWSMMGGVYDAQGNLIEGISAPFPTEGIWWDQELDREIVQTSGSHYNVYIQDFFKGREIEIAKLSGYRYLTVYAKRAAFWGDIIGDWREELILRHVEGGVCVGITGFTTDYTTTVNNIYCLMEDPHYRLDCTTKGYYQSPNTGFYLGYDMPRPQLPPCMVTDLIANADGTFTDYRRSGNQTYSDDKSLLLDLTFGSAEFPLNHEIKPSVLYAMPVRDQVITMGNQNALSEGTATGSIGGTGDVWKGQVGTLEVNGDITTFGTTYITEGTLGVNGKITGPVELRARGTLTGCVDVNDIRFEGALNYEGCRLQPGLPYLPTGMRTKVIGVMTFNKGLKIDHRVFMNMKISGKYADHTDIADEELRADIITVIGDLEVTSPAIFDIDAQEEEVKAGKYTLITYTGEFKGSLDNFSVMGLTGISYSIVDENKSIQLVINAQREPATEVVWTGAESNVWDYQTENFQLGTNATEFVAKDAVVVNDDAVKTTIQVDDVMPVASVTFENDTKTITVQGNGGFSNGDLVKNGKGRVNMNLTHSNYIGKTIINDGILAVKELADAGVESSIGAASVAAANFQIGKGTLYVDNSNTATNRGVMLTDTATIMIPSGTTALKGKVEGKGRMVKKGAGQLNITYGGANTWSGGTELAAGTLAMGAWNTTFGTATSAIDVTGNSRIVIFNNNSTSAVPSLKNVISIAKGKTLTVDGGQRCKVQGTLKGEGTLKISFPYVRGDFESNTSAFEGTLEVTSGQFRITTALDLSKAIFKLDAGVYAASLSSQGGSETSRTIKIGSLESTATDCSFGTGVWNVGYRGENSTFAGAFNSSATLNKYGEGALTLTGASAANMNVNEGVLEVENTSKETTTGLITVNDGGTLSGRGTTASVLVKKGGKLAAGKSAVMTSTMTISNSLTVNDGGYVRVRGRGTSSVDAYKVAGNVRLTNPIFKMERLSGDWEADAELKVFTGDGKITVTGTPRFEPSVPMAGYMWDTSVLESEGIIRVVADPVGIRGVYADEQEEVTYDLSGRRITTDHGHAVRIINGKKVFK